MLVKHVNSGVKMGWQRRHIRHCDIHPTPTNTINK